MDVLVNQGKSALQESIISPVEVKKNKLISILYSVLESPLYRKDLSTLMAKLSLTEERVIQSYLDYNLDIYSTDNEIYHSLSNRVVLHIHNLVAGSWHQDRQAAIIELLQMAQPKTLIDVGFGVPTKYIKDLVLQNKLPITTLCDFSDTAFQFSTALLDQWDINWHEVIAYKQIDMNNADAIGCYDTYLFQDSIEHVPNPEACLSNYVRLSPTHSTFILSLPIGPIFPRHYIAWLSDKDAIEWLEKCGLKTNYEKVVQVNPLVDLFAEQLGEDFHNLFVLCSKINLHG